MTVKLAWCTDIHLDFCSPSRKNQFYEELRACQAHAIAITGDISTGNDVLNTLEELAATQVLPIWFVLGNHDYYDSSITTIRSNLHELCKQYDNLFWMDDHTHLSISPNTSVIGHSGWGDAKNGDFLQTPVRINDHRKIQELSGLPRTVLQKKLHALGEEAAEHFHRSFSQLNHEIRTVWVLTHVPPFPETAWHGEDSGHWDWIPDFTCKSVGDTLLHWASKQPDWQINVLCGHGHSKGEVWVRDNLFVRTGEARYKHPKIIDIIDLC